ncbi:MAG TPA: hypothetical protein VFS59_11990 [Gemmatimonadaceae bacterium]|nr:hypothetical protein [Gemmatimonadaceae bacterium]
MLAPSIALCCAAYAPADAQRSSPRPRAASESLPGRVVDVNAGDYFFEAPDSVPAGIITLRLWQRGDMGHMLWLVRLPPGRTVADLHRDEVRHAPTSWAEQLGGPGYANPAVSSNATYQLTPGDYALVCYVGSGRGVDSLYHVWRGMIRPLRVTAAAGGRARALVPPTPAAVARITNDSLSWSAPLRPGRRLVRVENRTSAWREFVLERVLEGRTIEEAQRWRRRSGTLLPTVAIGGLASLPPGGSIATTLELPPGDYVVKTHVARDSGLYALRLRRAPTTR